MSTKKIAPAMPGQNVTYHGDHIPNELIGQEITYTFNWPDVTDPAALAIRNGTAEQKPAEAPTIVTE